MLDPPLTRQVVLVTTSDRLQIPPIKRFYQLVSESLSSLEDVEPNAIGKYIDTQH
jgi:hypothetical protein